MPKFPDLTNPTPTPQSPLPAPAPDVTPSIDVSENPSLNSNPTSQEAVYVKKSPFRYIIPILLALGIIALIIYVVTKVISPNPVSKSNPSKSSAQSIELTYWGLWEPNEILDQILSDFTASHPGVSIKYIQQSPKDYRERLQNAINNDQGPDIFRYHHTWGAMLTNQLSSLPSSIMTPTEYEATFYPINQSWLKSDRGYLGIPLMFDGLALYYNKTILATAAKTPPTTWEELRQTAQALTLRNAEGKIQRSGVALGTTANVDNWSDIIGLMLLQNSAQPNKPNNALGQDALTFYTIFSKTDQIWDNSMPSSTYAFATEKVAMIIAPSWRAHEVLDINPNLDFAIAPIPQLSQEPISWGSFWVEGVSNKSSKAKQEMAWELLKYLSTKEIMRQFYTTASQQRTFGEPFSRVDLADQLKGDPYVGAFIKDAPYAQSWYLSSFTHDNGINDKIIKYYENAINSINSGQSVDQSLSTAEQGIAQILEQYF